MRIMISPHDTTESILSTVKNFYGLYEGKGVRFEDWQGNALTARYDNFEADMVIYVRVIGETLQAQKSDIQSRVSASPKKPRLDAASEMRPPQTNHALSYPCPASRTARKRSVSPPSNRSRRSASAMSNSKPRIRPGLKSRGSSTHGSFVDQNADGYSSSDGGNGSVSSSRKARNEQLTSADISLDNIVEGGRRKRAKFESSELPLFVAPQVPMTASVSSVSPQRRISSNNGASPFSYSNQHTFAYTQPPHSPQSYGHGDATYMQGGLMNTSSYLGSSAQQHGHRLRGRGSVVAYPSSRPAYGGVLPTPDPTTVGSVISDKDVALQLMRLGDASNFSYGRTSTSTLDDALSGKAEVASSEEESEDDGALPAVPQYTIEESTYNNVSGPSRSVKRLLDENLHSTDSTHMASSGDEYEDIKDDTFHGASGSNARVAGQLYKTTKSKSISIGPSNLAKPRAGSFSSKGTGKMGKPHAPFSVKNKSKVLGNGKTPISPSSLPSQSRKTSNASTLNFQHQPRVDEEDLSSKRRCQRCRKSKKGCDRRRPCQRCKDAGIGVEGCVSEDEGNGRKGRYGRHTGVPVKKGEGVEDEAEDFINGYVPVQQVATDASKKRKRQDFEERKSRGRWIQYYHDDDEC
ncbi:hypothetical protein B0A49_12987 [Cryomyces minteri]|uniref:Zn(2)-C6 fungal-type domain-containing protein n=1 Tax=Cryomyces minteri TaxID=331657 RepID=A0A4U0VW64_9PEZI|nr:hypothetical protein B0A49_12987 [Cryomyces minteri]